MILCVGEILADMAGVVTNGAVCYERRAGGAPFNVACALKKLGAEVGFVGCVGDDSMGKFLTDFASARKFDVLEIGKDAQTNTTLAFVDIDEAGERSFCFHRKNTADIYLPEIPDDLLGKTSIVHVGSLMLSEERGEKYALSLCRRAHVAGSRISFDVNFRDDVFRNRAAAVRSCKKIIEEADIIKFSEDELEIFTKEYIDSLSSDKLVCISLGKAGSMWLYDGKKSAVPPIFVKPVDTTGAGDAFFSGVLNGLCGINAPYDSAALDRIFFFANVCGALNTLGRGAIDNLPDLETVNERIHNER